MQNVNQTVVSEYANSPTLLQIINAFNQAIDPTVNFQLFYDAIWNLKTASGYGLDVWGRIVGVTRTLTLPVQQFTFGFNAGISGDFAPWGQAPFSGGTGQTATYTLSDTDFRTLIFAKAAANICFLSAPTLNALLTTLFGEAGRGYTSDYANMLMGITFEFNLSHVQAAILAQSGVVPKPTGVRMFVYQLPPGGSFGFAEAGPTNSAPFGQRPFFSGASIIEVLSQARPAAAPLGRIVLGSNAIA